MLPGRTLLAPMLAAVVALAGCGLRVPGYQSRAPEVEVASSPSPVATPTPRPPIFAPPAPAPPSPQPPTRGPRPELVFVGNTDGDGVFLRRLSAIAERLDAFPDGTPLAVIGASVDAFGETWIPVRAPDGTEGWVAERFTVDSPPPGATAPVFAPVASPVSVTPAVAPPAVVATPVPAPKPAPPTSPPAPKPAQPAEPGPPPAPKVFIPPLPPTGIPVPGAVPGSRP